MRATFARGVEVDPVVKRQAPDDWIEKSGHRRHSEAGGASWPATIFAEWSEEIGLDRSAGVAPVIASSRRQECRRSESGRERRSAGSMRVAGRGVALRMRFEHLRASIRPCRPRRSPAPPRPRSPPASPTSAKHQLPTRSGATKAARRAQRALINPGWLPSLMTRPFSSSISALSSSIRPGSSRATYSTALRR